MEVIFLFAGLIIGVIVWLIFYFKYLAKYTPIEEKNKFLESEVDAAKIALEKKEKEIIDLNRNLSGQEATLKNLKEKLNEQRDELEKMEEKFRLEFKNLANEIFEEKSKKFTDQNKNNLTALLDPLKDKIKDFEQKVEQSNKDSIDRNSALKQQIKGLKDLNLKMTTDAENLTRALKGESKTMGNWGEFILENILEKSGLVKGREYEIQESLRSEDGNQKRPDIIVNLPEKKKIIIDSKVSLVAYEKYVNTESKENEKEYLRLHVNSLKRHIQSLSEKKYQDLYNIAGLDFVLLFMPVEPAFSLAVQNDEKLFLNAYEKNIVIVSPSTLIATLRTIASIWRQEYQNRNALEIARQGGALFDKFAGFLKDLLEIGKKLDDTQQVYKASMNKLSEGKGNLIKKAQDIKELGANTRKKLPQDLIDKL